MKGIAVREMDDFSSVFGCLNKTIKNLERIINFLNSITRTGAKPIPKNTGMFTCCNTSEKV